MMKLVFYVYFLFICLAVSVWQCLLKPSQEILQNWGLGQLASIQVPSSTWLVWTGRYPEIYSPPVRKQHGYFLHITDMHVDEDYIQGSTVSTACHQLPNSMDIAKKKKKHKPDVLAGKYGAPGERCDAPIILAKETLDWITKEWKDKLDFVVWTGDNSKHDWDKKNNKRKRRHVYELNQRVTEMVMETFWNHDKIPVIPSFGNNDVYPHNQIGGPDTDSDLLYFYEQLWRAWLPLSQRPTFREGGYFIRPVAPRLNVLTLNTMYFYTKNHAVHNCLHPTSPAAIQMQWFERQLEKARIAQERIYVIGHVPPSPRDYKGTCFTEFMRIATNYTDVVMGNFFAHLNMDHFLMFDGHIEKQDLPSMDNDGDLSQVIIKQEEEDHLEFHTERNVKSYTRWLRNMYLEIDPLDGEKWVPVNGQPPIVVIQVAPSVLPVYHPAIRIYQYEITPNDDTDDTDGTDDTDNDDDHDDNEDDDIRPYGTLLGYQQYFANLTKWNDPLNDNNQSPIEYELEYSTREAYGLEDLSVESYFELAKLMVEDSEEGNKLWSTYLNHIVVNTKNYTD